MNRMMTVAVALLGAVGAARAEDLGQEKLNKIFEGPAAPSKSTLLDLNRDLGKPAGEPIPNSLFKPQFFDEAGKGPLKVGGEIGGGFTSGGAAGFYGAGTVEKDFGKHFFVKGVLGYGKYKGDSKQTTDQHYVGQQNIQVGDPLWPGGAVHNMYERTVQYKDLTVEIGPSVEAGVKFGDKISFRLSAILAMAKVKETQSTRKYVDYVPVDPGPRTHNGHIIDRSDTNCQWISDWRYTTYCWDEYIYHQHQDQWGDWYDEWHYDGQRCESVWEDWGYDSCTTDHWQEIHQHTLSPFTNEISRRDSTLQDTGWKPAPGIGASVNAELNEDVNVGINYKLLFLPNNNGTSHTFAVEGQAKLTD